MKVPIHRKARKENDLAAACSSCGYLYPDPQSIASQKPEDRSPCPQCRTMGITFNVSLSSKVKLRGMLGAKAKRANAKKPFLELKTGQDFHRKSGRWNVLWRKIDRDNDRYQELITDPATGKVIRRTSEPLSHHRGHGSAKTN